MSITKKEVKIKLKKIVLALILVIIVMQLIACGYYAEPEHMLYPRAVYVSEIKLEDDIVVFEDGAGFTWEFTGVEDWGVGDVAAMLMDDNGTPETIYDDYVIETWYGW